MPRMKARPSYGGSPGLQAAMAGKLKSSKLPHYPPAPTSARKAWSKPAVTQKGPTVPSSARHPVLRGDAPPLPQNTFTPRAAAPKPSLARRAGQKLGLVKPKPAPKPTFAGLHPQAGAGLRKSFKQAAPKMKVPSLPKPSAGAKLKVARRDAWDVPPHMERPAIYETMGRNASSASGMEAVIGKAGYPVGGVHRFSLKPNIGGKPYSPKKPARSAPLNRPNYKMRLPA